MGSKKETILAICAHNDDYIIGAGGTLAKYSAEGKQFYSIVFSYGEKSHPHIKRRFSVKQRVKESIRADKALGGAGVFYLGLEEGTFLDEENREGIIRNISKVINEKRPTRIFTHSLDDAHPDHRATHHVVKEALARANYSGEVYSFDVWNFFHFRGSDQPQLIVDVKETFDKKIYAFKLHKSQKVAIWTLMWNVYLTAILNGLKHGYTYCEVFNKIQ